jgi:ankyrin repeat protein
MHITYKIKRIAIGLRITIWLAILSILILFSCKSNKLLIYSTIHEAVQKGDLEDVKEHLKRGVAINAQDENGWTPLHVAVFYGQKEIVEYLISKGADINAVVPWVGTPLTIAEEYMKKEVPEEIKQEIIKLLEKHGAKH